MAKETDSLDGPKAPASKPPLKAKPWKPKNATEAILGRPVGSLLNVARRAPVGWNGVVPVGNEVAAPGEESFSSAG